MSKTIDRISFSSLINYITCPYYFKLLHVDEVKKREGNIFMSFGTAVHFICEHQLKNDIKKEEINELFDGKFHEELIKLPQETIDKQFVSDLRKQGKNIFPQLLNSMKEYFGPFETISIEFPLLEPITEFETKLNFKGFLDAVIKTQDGKYHIIDFKTCIFWDAQKKSDKNVIYQLIYYKNYYSKKLNIPLEQIECHFILLKRTAKKDNVECFKITSGKKRIENAIEYMRIPCYNIEHNRFLKRKTSCENCEFKNTEYCK